MPEFMLINIRLKRVSLDSRECQPKKSPQNHTQSSKSSFCRQWLWNRFGFQGKEYLFQLGSVGLEQSINVNLHSMQRAGPCRFSTAAS